MDVCMYVCIGLLLHKEIYVCMDVCMYRVYNTVSLMLCNGHKKSQTSSSRVPKMENGLNPKPKPSYKWALTLNFTFLERVRPL